MPSQSVQNVKDYFSRHFLGVVKVNYVPTSVATPQVFSPKRSVEVRSARLETKIKVSGAELTSVMDRKVNVNSAKLLPAGGIPCVSHKFKLSSHSLKINESKIRRYTSGELVLRTFSKLNTKARNGARQIGVIPQERANRLQWQLSRPRKEGEMILAWYGPIVEDAVAKIALNKRRGTLLIWYNPQSRHFDTKGLYLYRRMGVKENLEWRWM